MYIQAKENGIKEFLETSPIWKLVHNNVEVLQLLELSGKGGIGGEVSLFVADTKEECLAEINKLGLILPEQIK